MKRLWPTLLLTFIIILGISFLIMVFRMVWFPPSTMGMMMGRNMMFHHMFFMFSQTLGVFILIIVLLFIIWIVKSMKNKKL